MLAAGEIDALVAPRAPRCFVDRGPGVGRLFADYRSAERDYFAKTGLFPIMHVIGVRRALLERHPWLASSVYKAFLKAKEIAVAELANSTALHATLPWLTAELEQTRSLMGEDYWPYGAEENRATLQALTRYSLEQGLTPRQLAIEDLFASSTLDRFKI
jgi:4,5-dihydroxyphthalate decarboxylase